MVMPQSELEKVREMMRKKQGGGRDPHEWKPPKAEPGTDLKFKFYILPPTDSMKGLWYHQHGAHYINNRRIECPRLHDDLQCPLCNFAFEMMRDITDKDKKSQISRSLLSSSRYAVNIYFPAYESTPVELRGKVFWYSLPLTIYQICEDVLYCDGPGEDPQDPQPFGLFYDPEAAHALSLQIVSKGGYNNYEKSRFLPTKTKISTKEGMIDKILEMRHDIPTKFADRDVAELEQIAVDLGAKNQLTNGKSSAETENKPKPPKTESKKAETEVEVEVEVGAETGAETEVEVEVGAETEVEVEVGAETEVEVEAEAGAGAETEVEVEAEAETKTEADDISDDSELNALIAKLKKD